MTFFLFPKNGPGTQKLTAQWIICQIRVVSTFHESENERAACLCEFYRCSKWNLFDEPETNSDRRSLKLEWRLVKPDRLANRFAASEKIDPTENQQRTRIRDCSIITSTCTTQHLTFYLLSAFSERTVDVKHWFLFAHLSMGTWYIV